jgi:hypothetical protein
MRLYQGAAEAAKLGHVELVSGYGPAGKTQVESLRAGQLNGVPLRLKGHRFEPLNPCKRIEQAMGDDRDLFSGAFSPAFQ